MSNPEPDKRDYLLPPGCKDLSDVPAAQQDMAPSVPYPPVTRNVRLPAKVSVRFLAEVSGQDLDAIVKVMEDLRVIVSVNRSVDFADAQKILRKYGIWADHGPTSV